MTYKTFLKYIIFHFRNLHKYFKPAVFSLLKMSVPPYDKVIWIISAPRSGSTWIQAIIQEVFNANVLFEPFHPVYGTYKNYINGDRIRKIDVSEDFLKLFQDTNLIKYWNFWTFQGNKLSLFKSKTLVVKSVRIGSVVPDLIESIYLPIVILRHPCAIAYGQAQIFDKPSDFLKKKQRLLADSRFDKHYNLINSLNSDFELRLFKNLQESAWHTDIDKYNDKIILLFYENVVNDPVKELGIVFRKFGSDQSSSKKFKFEKKSFTANNSFKGGNNNLIKWRQGLSNNQFKISQNMFSYFGYTLYNLDSDYPNLCK